MPNVSWELKFVKWNSRKDLCNPTLNHAAYTLFLKDSGDENHQSVDLILNHAHHYGGPDGLYEEKCLHHMKLLGIARLVMDTFDEDMLV